MAEDTILDPALIAKIEQLTLLSKKVFTGRIRGERRSKKKGVSIEFADYRDYTQGDDLRFLDWNVYGRLDRLFLKMFMEEEDLTIYVLLDASESMNFGSPTKFLFGKRLGAALGYVGLAAQDRVGVGVFSNKVQATLVPTRGKAAIWQLLRFLEPLRPGGETDLGASCKDFALRNKRKGLLILISDFMDRRGYEAAIRFFLANNLDIHLIQVLSREELDPPFAGDVKLIDSEDSDSTEVTLGAPVLKRYRKLLTGFTEGLEKYARSRGMGYTLTASNRPVDEILLDTFRRGGLVK